MTDEPDQPDQPTPRARVAPPLDGDLVRWVLAGVLVVGIALLSGVTALRWIGDDDPRLDDAPVSVGEEAAQQFFSLDHRTLDEDIDEVLSSATGDFEQQYEKESADLRKAVVDQRLVLTATVPESGAAVEYLGDDEAWILVSVDVHTESRGGTPQDSRYRTRVVLEKTDDRWLVARLEQVG